MEIRPGDRSRIAARLSRGDPVELDWGLVLAPPSLPGTTGPRGAYRWTFYDPPLRPDGRRGERRHRMASRLDEKTWLRIEADLAALETIMVGEVTPFRMDATFGELAHHWLEPSRHPDWSEGYADKVERVTRLWLLDDRITVGDVRTSVAGRVPLRELALK